MPRGKSRTENSDRPDYQADASIRKHRTTSVTVAVLKKDHTPLTNQEIVVAQRNHKFLFGCTGFEIIPLANGELVGAAKAQVEQLSEKLINLFNFITLPFYWGRFEPQHGRPDTRRLINSAQWFTERGILVKGHPLCWHTVAADWLMDMSNADITRAQVARIQREVTDFAGLVDAWDVINEVVIMPIFDKYDNGITRICRELGRFDMIRTMFEAARSADPGAILLLNDFDVSTAYEILIEGCLELGIKIDAIGIQSHMHQGYWGVDKTLAILDRFARFNLPIHFTENTLVSGHLMPPEIVDLNDYQVDEWSTTPEGEARQAQEVVQHYRTLLSHPAVEAITWWGLPDGGWLKAPSGLVRRDGSSKPAYEALSKLVKGEWWLASTKMMTDGEGKLRFNGFLGEYTLSWAGNEAILHLEKAGPATAEAVF
jgi:endo-1,4-beta-xylanase